ncbi:hypothetical protein FACS1894172_21550 [Spirochaetia bacterium]|nr:hypothetical protein FACS1894172_21550 [Spirochaetia bacterium]
MEDALFILNTILSDPFTALPVAKELTALLIPESPDIEPEKVQRIVKIMFT